MDLLDWNKIDRFIPIIDTKKKFFNKYYYNIKYYCPGGRILLKTGDIDIDKEVEIKNELSKDYNYGGSWRIRPGRTIIAKQIIAMSNIKRNYGDRLKFRIEEPNITIYSDDESLLYKLATDDLLTWQDSIMNVCRPAKESYKPLLDNGAILLKTHLDYKYKFVCRDGHCENKESIYKYLDGLDREVKVSDTVWSMLEKTSKYVWGVWFYGNDPDIAKFLNIIEPNFVTNIHEVIVVHK